MPHFETFDGKSLFYDDQGDGQAVVLLHGFVGDINIDWVRSGILDRLLDEGYRVIAFDARGHGLSDKPHELSAYENEALTKDAQALLDQIGLDQYMLVGFSMGARTALHVAAIDPRIHAVVALGLGENSMERNARGMNTVGDALLTDDPDSIEHESLRHFREMADAIHADHESLAALMTAERTEVSDLLDDVKVPILIVTGSDDVTAGDPGPLADRFPNAKGVQTAGDHAGVKDQPVTQEAIVEFLASQ
jgi:pimeloyl-ACP methyl ester carboxylesterase